MTIAADVLYEMYLEENVARLLADIAFKQSLLDSFWTGDLPDNATLDHMVLARAGRLRLNEKAKVCALLSSINLTD